jgi:hypothetical protein
VQHDVRLFGLPRCFWSKLPLLLIHCNPARPSDLHGELVSYEKWEAAPLGLSSGPLALPARSSGIEPHSIMPSPYPWDVALPICSTPAGSGGARWRRR